MPIKPSHRGKRKYTRKTKKSNPTPSKSFTKKVVKVMAKQQESRYSSYESGNIACVYTAASTPPTVFDMIPPVPQGLDDGYRTGNMIYCKKYLIDVYMSYSEASSASTDRAFNVRLMIGRMKEKDTTPSNVNFNNMFYTSTGILAPFDSTNMASLNRLVNTNYVTIYHDKIYKIGSSFNSYSGQVAANNDYALSRNVRIDVTKYFRGRWKYGLENDSDPDNKSLWIWAFVTTSDGSVVSARMPFFNAVSHIWYTDC